MIVFEIKNHIIEKVSHNIKKDSDIKKLINIFLN